MRLRLPNYLWLISASVSLSTTLDAANTQSSYIYDDYYTLLEDIEKYTGSEIPSHITITGNGQSVVNGSEHHGFQIMGTNAAHDMTLVTVSGIAAFTGFADSPNLPTESVDEAGAAFMLIAGSQLEFVGYDVNNRILFSNNTVTGSGTYAEGAAMHISGGSNVGNIYADFDGNAVYLNDVSTSGSYARGAALNIGSERAGAPKEVSTTGDIYGKFTNNIAEFGGAIYVGQHGKIGDIYGSFTGNIADGSSRATGSTGAASGGALRVYLSDLSDIYADFKGNIAYGEGSAVNGGAIALTRSSFENNIGIIQGDMRENICYSERSGANGGFFSIMDQVVGQNIHIVDSTIEDNIVATKSGSARGGAFFVDDSAVYIEARQSNVLISDNYSLTGATWDDTSSTVTGGVRDYNAIYSVNSTLNLLTQQGNTITINDSIYASSASQMSISSTSERTEGYDVYLNDAVINWDVIVDNARVKLGSHTHKDNTLSPTGDFVTNAGLRGSTLSISSTSLVNTSASYLNAADSISNKGDIEFTGGDLKIGINLDQADLTDAERSGNYFIQADTIMSNGAAVYGDTVHVNDTLLMQAAASVDVKTLLYSGYDMHDINGTDSTSHDGKQIVMEAGTTMDFDLVRLEIGHATRDDYFDLIVSDDATGPIVHDIDGYEVEFYLGGALLERNEHYQVSTLDDGGLRIHFIYPEPSTVTLSLVALTGLLARRRRRRPAQG